MCWCDECSKEYINNWARVMGVNSPSLLQACHLPPYESYYESWIEIPMFYYPCVSPQLQLYTYPTRNPETTIIILSLVRWLLPKISYHSYWFFSLFTKKKSIHKKLIFVFELLNHHFYNFLRNLENKIFSIFKDFCKVVKHFKVQFFWRKNFGR